MRSTLAPACLAALAFAAPRAAADFIFTDPGSYHLSATATDFSGTDSFDWVGDLDPGDGSDSDFAETPGLWTTSGAAFLSTITSTLIDLRGFTDSTNAVDATVSALAEVALTFTIESERLVSWDYSFLLIGEGTEASVTLSGPDGLVPIGLHTLGPGMYTITASAGFTDHFSRKGDTTIFARFLLTLEQIPSPGALALLAVAGLRARSRRRPLAAH